MFMEVAITAIGIAIVLMVGYLVIAQVRAALPLTNLNANVSGNVSAGWDSVQSTAFAGLGLIAVGIIVLAAFALVSIFRQ
jgi:high-affinity nickel permease